MQDNQVLQQEAVETKVCSTCKLPIEVSKFRIHEIGCARNNYRCPTCGDLVAKAEKEEHEKEAHTKVVCQFCQIEFEKRQHQAHEDQCFMRPKDCKYCEQTINFADYEKHIGYCGSKTKKCLTCGRNVCLKDQDSHQYGGECKAFQEEDIRLRLEEQKRQEAEKKRREEEKIKIAQKQQQREKMYDDNFNMDDIEYERGGGLQERLPKQNDVKASKHQQMSSAPKQTNLGSYLNKPQEQIAAQSTQSRGVPQNLPSSKLPQSQASGYKLPSQQVKPQANPLQQRAQPSTQQQRPGSRTNVPSQLQKQEEVKQTGVGARQLINSSANQSKSKQVVVNNLKKDPKGPIVNQNIGLSSKLQQQQKQQPVQQPRPQIKPEPQPPKQAKLVHNQQPLASKQYDPNEALIAKMLEEDEDNIIASEMQNNLYTGDNHGQPKTNAAVNQRQAPARNHYDDFPMQEQLIGGARDHFYDEWGMDEHAAAQNFGMNDANMGLDDAEYQRIIEESLRSHGGANIDDEQLQRVLEASRQQY